MQTFDDSIRSLSARSAARILAEIFQGHHRNAICRLSEAEAATSLWFFSSATGPGLQRAQWETTDKKGFDLSGHASSA